MADKGNPSSLRELLNKHSSLPFLFIGAGISQRYLALPNWRDLIRSFANQAMPGNKFAFEVYKNMITSDTISDSTLLPAITSNVAKDFTNIFLIDSAYEEMRNKYVHEISNGISPFKIAVSDFFINSDLSIQDQSLEDEFSSFKRIARHISGVITTNYDCFLEKQVFKNFVPYIGQEELLFKLSYAVGEIYKIHGCCSVPNSLVIDKKDYDDFNSKNAYLAAKLLTIFIEHPIIFMGYSIQDSNIIEILKAIACCLSELQLETLKDRLVFIEWTEIPDKCETSSYTLSFADGRYIDMLRITTNKFTSLYDDIASCNSKYSPRILRRLKEDVYELVKTNDPNSKLHVVDFNDETNMENLEVVIGVGVYKNVGIEGYSGLKPEDLYKDVIYDDKEYNPEWVVLRTLPELIRHFSGSIPMYKYISQCPQKLPEVVSEKKKNSFDEFLSATIINHRARNSLSFHSIPELLLKYDIKNKDDLKKFVSDVVLLKENEITLPELEKAIKNIFEFHKDILNSKHQNLKTNFKRLIKIYDWLKYGQ